MGVHGEGERGRAAVIGQRAQHRGQIVDVGAAAAKLARHAGLDQAGLLQQGEIVGDEAILVGRIVGALGEVGPSSRAISTALRRVGCVVFMGCGGIMVVSLA